MPPRGRVPEGSAQPEPRYVQGKDKGFFGTLFDTNFDHMVTTKVITLFYRVALVMISLLALVMLWYGQAFLKDNAMLGIMTLLAVPLLWLFIVLFVRVFLEFTINQFKITEYLRVMKDQDS
jgi:hypothetical protein